MTSPTHDKEDTPWEGTEVEDCRDKLLGEGDKKEDSPEEEVRILFLLQLARETRTRRGQKRRFGESSRQPRGRLSRSPTGTDAAGRREAFVGARVLGRRKLRAFFQRPTRQPRQSFSGGGGGFRSRADVAKSDVSRDDRHSDIDARRRASISTNGQQFQLFSV